MKTSKKTLFIFAWIAYVQNVFCSFESLSDDVKKLILAQPVLDQKDLCRCAKVSKNFRTLSDLDNTWQHLQPRFSVEILMLIHTHCQSVDSLFKSELPKISGTAIPIKIQCRMFHLLLANKELIKIDLNKLSSSLATSLTPSKYKSKPKIMKRIEPFINISSDIKDEFFIFVEKYDDNITEGYLRTFLEGLFSPFTYSSHEELVILYKTPYDIFTLYIKRGSQVAIKLRDEVISYADPLKIKLEID